MGTNEQKTDSSELDILLNHFEDFRKEISNEQKTIVKDQNLLRQEILTIQNKIDTKLNEIIFELKNFNQQIQKNNKDIEKNTDDIQKIKDFNNDVDFKTSLDFIKKNKDNLDEVISLCEERYGKDNRKGYKILSEVLTHFAEVKELKHEFKMAAGRRWATVISTIILNIFALGIITLIILISTGNLKIKIF